MATPVVNFRLPLPLLERIDAARGAEPRTRWLVRAAENQLALEAATGLRTVLDDSVPPGEVRFIGAGDDRANQR
jgi:hypothetical protein